SQNKVLESMVKRIQEREKNANTVVPVSTKPQEIVNEMQQAIDSSNALKAETAHDKKLRISTVARKGNTPPDAKQPAASELPDVAEKKEPLVSNAVIKVDETKD